MSFLERELFLVKMALSPFIGEVKVYTGTSATSSARTFEHVCEELMECAASVGFIVTSVLSSFRQYVVELCQGDERGLQFLEDPSGRPGSTVAACSD